MQLISVVLRALLFGMLTCLVLFGQTKDELRRRFGQPVSETFTVRPGILVTARYGADGRVTEYLVAPENRAQVKSRGSSIMSKEIAAEIIDELVPKWERGKFLMGGFVNMGCLPDADCAGTTENYERVAIYFNSAPEFKVHYAVVTFKH